jgi:C-terminal processing protease CtpA/Prc
LECINFDEKIVISNIAENLANKIPLKSEIIKINDIPVIEFLKDSIFPYVSASNAHWKFANSVSQMFFGAPQSTVKITVKTPEGKQEEVEMIRGVKEEMAVSSPVSPINIKIMDDDIGYIRLSSFLYEYYQTIDSVFLSWVPQLKNTKGLIVDIRGNRGGGSRSWFMVAACLKAHLKQSLDLPGTYLSRKNIPVYASWGKAIWAKTDEFRDYYLGTAMEEFKQPNPTNTNIPERLQLRQPLMIISDNFVGSSTEYFLALMKESGRATVIGSPSVGCMTACDYIPLSLTDSSLSGPRAMISIEKYLNPDGIQYYETGILPDIEVNQDYHAWMEGRDNVLERAIEELRKKI